jgi:hypothetical protein
LDRQEEHFHRLKASVGGDAFRELQRSDPERPYVGLVVVPI